MTIEHSWRIYKHVCPVLGDAMTINEADYVLVSGELHNNLNARMYTNETEFEEPVWKTHFSALHESIWPTETFDDTITGGNDDDVILGKSFIKSLCSQVLFSFALRNDWCRFYLWGKWKRFADW